MIPHSFVSGTFYDASGNVRASQTVTFMPLSTPYAVAGELVLSIPQHVTLNASGQLFEGGDLFYRLAKGYYRVIATDTDAFFISVSDDGLVHDIDTLASELDGLPSELKRVLASLDIYNASADSLSIKRTLAGDAHNVAGRNLFIGELSGLAVTTPPLDMFTSKLAAAYVNLDALITGSNYYKVSWVNVAIFVLNSSDSEPDGNTVSSDQATWLRTQLETAPERWKVVVFKDTPFTSVAGKSKAAMDWPFGAWGANAVIAAGAKVMEHFTLPGDIPLFVTGCGGTGAKDTLGAPLSNQEDGFTNVRSMLLMTSYQGKLEFRFLDIATGQAYYSFNVIGKTDQKLTWSVSYAWDSGFKQGHIEPSLELEPYGVAKLLNVWSNNMVRIMDPQTGGVVPMESVPTPAIANANPWLKRSIIAVGDDPVRMYWWNKAKGDFVELLASAFTGYSYYGGARSQLGQPSFTPGSGSLVGTVIDHPDQTVEIWVSEDGQAFEQLTTWPATKLYLFQTPVTSRPVFLAAFARKAGSLDSEVFSSVFTLL